jgi:hypothetical protein
LLYLLALENGLEPLVLLVADFAIHQAAAQNRKGFIFVLEAMMAAPPVPAEGDHPDDEPDEHEHKEDPEDGEAMMSVPHVQHLVVFDRSHSQGINPMWTERCEDVAILWPFDTPTGTKRRPDQY